LVRRSRGLEPPIERLLQASALLSVFTTLAILGVLVFQALDFFKQVSLLEFLTDRKWTPLFNPQHFGVLPLVSGTFLVTVIALLVAVPVGLGTAIYLSEYAPEKVRRVVKPILEVLTGIPSVVYGYFALTFVTPLIRRVFSGVIVFNALSAGIAMGVMIIPLVSSLSEDVMVAVPNYLRKGAYALGAKKHEVVLHIVLRSAFSGIIASIILAVSRALGETMIVSIAAGSTPRLTLNPLESIQTLTGYITQISLGETPYGSLEYKTIFSVGLTLFTLVFSVNLMGNYLIQRYWRRV